MIFKKNGKDLAHYIENVNITAKSCRYEQNTSYIGRPIP